MANTFDLLKKDSADLVIEYFNQATQLTGKLWNLRTKFEDIDRAYQREEDCTEDTYKAKLAKRLRGDTTKFQNVTLPLIMPQVESAVAYQQSVFLTGYPIFGAVSSPEHVDAASQLDAIIGDQQTHGKWVAELLKPLRNGFKYNFGPMEVCWDRERVFKLGTPSNISGGTPKAAQQQKGIETEVVWQGNKLKNLDPYNSIIDTRVAPSDLHTKGEFAGYTELMSRMALKQFIEMLPTRSNVKEAFESGTSNSDGYYLPTINPESIYETNAEMSWFRWAGMQKTSSSIDYKDYYHVSTLYARILPKEFKWNNVAGKNVPQVWKFIIVNGQIPVYVEPQGNAHSFLPIIIAQPHEDGLGYQTKSFAKNVEPFQDIVSALSNSNIAARRRSVGDRIFYDPGRISKGAISNDNPIERVPVRATAFGTSVSDAVYVAPFRDDQSAYTGPLMQQFIGMANQASGLNPARQGQFVKGNKTRHEFAEIMSNANGRDQLVALSLEGNFFMPIKQIIKANILEFQPDITLLNTEKSVTVPVDMKVIRSAMLEFKLSDGLTPSEKLIDGESLSTAFQTLAQNQQIGAGYNITPMFSYLMKSAGADLQPFEKSQEQQAYEQAVGAWQQAVAQVAEQITKNIGEGELDVEKLKQALPPQPLPEQFGYVPEAPVPNIRKDGKSVLGRYSETENARGESNATSGGNPAT